MHTSLSEDRRLAALQALRLLDTPPEERFDRLTRLAQHVFSVPFAYLSLVDAQRQWLKSRQGIEVQELPRKRTFCEHVLLAEGVVVVPDAASDKRLAGDPLVKGKPKVRFYAGCSLAMPDGSRIGMLCIADTQPRDLNTHEIALLGDLARIAEDELQPAGDDIDGAEQVDMPLWKETAAHEEIVRQIAETLDDVLWLIDPHTREIIYISPAYERIWGRSREKLAQGMDIFLEAVHPDDQERVKAALSTWDVGDYNVEYRIVRPDDTVRWIHGRTLPVRDSDGAIVRVVGINTDITERKLTGQALEDSERRYRQIVEMADDVVYVLDAKQRTFIFINQAAERLVGYTGEELARMTVIDLVPPTWHRLIETYYRRQIVEQIPQTTRELPIITSSGETKWIEQTVTLLPGYGVPTRLQGIARDVTRRKLAEIAFYESEERYYSVISALTEGVMLLDAQGYIRTANASAEALLGLPIEEIMRRVPFSFNGQIVHEDGTSLSSEQHPVLATLRDGHSRFGEVVRIDKPSGETSWLSFNVCPLFEEDRARPHAVVVSVSDVTRRKQAEDAEREQREFALQVMNTMGQGLIVANQDGILEYVNPAFAGMMGYAPEDMLGWQIDTLIVMEDRPALSQVWARRERGEVNRYEARLICADGNTIYTLITGVPRIRDERVIGTIAVFTDLTERLEVEKALSAYAKELASLHQASGRLLSPGSDLKTLTRQIIQAVTEEIDAADCAVWLFDGDQGVLRMVDGTNDPTTNDMLAISLEDAGLIATAFRIDAVVYTPYVKADPRSLETDPTIRSELCIPLRGGGKVIGVLGMKSPDINAFNEQKQRILTAFAERAGLALENARLMERLERAREAAEAGSRAKSEFLTNMSHEIRTPLNGVVGMLELAQDTDLTHEQHDYVLGARTSAEVLLDLIDDILDLSKVEAGRLDLEEVDFDLNRVVGQAITMVMPRAAAKGLKLLSRIGTGVLPALRGDPVRLRQVILNLLGNAVKFTDKGKVMLAVSLEQVNQDEITLHFSVQDTGIGIPLEQQRKIFDAFTQADGSTTRKYGGTGLGLAISQRLVEKFGGRIWVESKVGRGSTFHFTATFGIIEPQHIKDVPSSGLQAASSVAGKHMQILLAEDNPINRQVMVAMLEKQGWQVTAVEDGLAAVEQTVNGDFDLVLMDVQMPLQDGFDATKQIRDHEQATGKRTPIVALTAHTMQGDQEKCLAAGMDGFLAKPVKMSAIHTIIEQMVGNTAANLALASSDIVSQDVLAMSEAMDYCDGDRALLGEVIRLFRKSWPIAVADLRAALEAEDAEHVYREAHRMKGQAGVLGARQVVNEAHRLEDLGEKGDLCRASVRLERLVAALERLDAKLAEIEKTSGSQVKGDG